MIFFILLNCFIIYIFFSRIQFICFYHSLIFHFDQIVDIGSQTACPPNPFVWFTVICEFSFMDCVRHYGSTMPILADIGWCTYIRFWVNKFILFAMLAVKTLKVQCWSYFTTVNLLQRVFEEIKNCICKKSKHLLRCSRLTFLWKHFTFGPLEIRNSHSRVQVGSSKSFHGGFG